MLNLTTAQLRKAYLDFFAAKGHRLVESDSLVPKGDASVLFTSAGMNQFKEQFLGKVGDFRTATSCQKCFRTGDLEEVGRTPSHHTFFEMLGNFSFGDYFKKEAILWAWEFVVDTLEIDSAKLWVSVYEDDQEAYEIWNKSMGLPADKIKRLGQKDNFWPSCAIAQGPNGPCGPCSEIYYTQEGGRSVELWNLVFTQFNRCDGGILEPLPSKNIDTGMGLERMSSVLQGVDSNFKIDVFTPITAAVRKLIDVCDERVIYTIADHARAISFCISDGVLPSNDGRGYVVRKLIRRCLFLAQQQNARPFIYQLVSSISGAMGDQYPQLHDRRENIARMIKAEEEKYIKNILEGGSEKLASVIENLKRTNVVKLPSDVALDLYVTYGITPDFTKEKCENNSICVDMDEIAVLIKEEQAKSRASSKMSGAIFAQGGLTFEKSEFVGYQEDACSTSIKQIVKAGVFVSCAHMGDHVLLVLEKTPFYPESGGQAGDQGTIFIKGTAFKIRIEDTKKEGLAIVHVAQVLGPAGDGRDYIHAGDMVEARVDVDYRWAVKRAHTATHILQAVLRDVLGGHVQQAGSYVEADRFRFDFTHFKDIGPEEMDDIQRLLNERVIKNDSLSVRRMPKEEAMKTGAMALFGEKYEDTVRVVFIGNYSKEFCGGTHLDSAGQVGLILIIAQSSVGSGVRRMEALTGKLAYKKLSDNFETLQDACDRLKTKPEQLVCVLDQLMAKQKYLEKESLKLKEKLLVFDIDAVLNNAQKINDCLVVVYEFSEFDVNLLRRAADLLRGKVSSRGIFFLASREKENVYFIVSLTEDMLKRGLSANDLIKKVLSCVGGSGGGRGDFAQGGVKEPQKMDILIREAKAVIGEALKTL